MCDSKQNRLLVHWYCYPTQSDVPFMASLATLALVEISSLYRFC